MSRFTVRVVLKGRATLDHYLALDAALARLNVTDDIQAEDGQWYRLPPGEYHCHGVIHWEDLLNRVSGAVRPVWPDFTIFVTEGQDRFWQGLDRIPPPR